MEAFDRIEQVLRKIVHVEKRRVPKMVPGTVKEIVEEEVGATEDGGLLVKRIEREVDGRVVEIVEEECCDRDEHSCCLILDFGLGGKVKVTLERWLG